MTIGSVRTLWILEGTRNVREKPPWLMFSEEKSGPEEPFGLIWEPSEKLRDGEKFYHPLHPRLPCGLYMSFCPRIVDYSSAFFGFG